MALILGRESLSDAEKHLETNIKNVSFKVPLKSVSQKKLNAVSDTRNIAETIAANCSSFFDG